MRDINLAVPAIFFFGSYQEINFGTKIFFVGFFGEEGSLGCGKGVEFNGGRHDGGIGRSSWGGDG
jgi:hypothetical protein